MPRFYFLIIFLCLSITTSVAEEKIVAKPFLHSYTQAHGDLRKDTIIYRQEKVIFGVDVKINENWSASVGFDLIGMNKPYLKPTVLTYRKDKLTINSGIFFTSELNINQRFWGNRFIEKVAADKWLRNPTADLGIRVAYQWNNFITTDVSLVSGNGYLFLLEKYHPKPAFRVILTPVQPLRLGGYISTRKEKDIFETTFNCFAHLQVSEKWKATGEFHNMVNYRFVEGNKINVMSFHSAYKLQQWLEMIARYDFIKSNKPNTSIERWNVKNDGHEFTGGLIFRCFPTVRTSINYRNKRPLVDNIEKGDWVFVCLEFHY